MANGTRKPATEAEMFALLRQRICRDGGNGPAAIVVPSVRSAAGFDARRTIDAVSLGLWPSRGMLLDGYEIKVSRSDWLRELKNPEKAEEFARLVDRLWLVIADPDIVKDGELPDGWGLLVRRGSQLRQEVEARRLHGARTLPPGFGRAFLVPLMRAAHAVPPDVRDELRAEAERQVRWRLDQAEASLRRLREQVAAFEKAAGIAIVEYAYASADDAAKRGVAFKAALGGEDAIDGLRQSAAMIARVAGRLHTQALEIAGVEAEAEAA